MAAHGGGTLSAAQQRACRHTERGTTEVASFCICVSMLIMKPVSPAVKQAAGFPPLGFELCSCVGPLFLWPGVNLEARRCLRPHTSAYVALRVTANSHFDEQQVFLVRTVVDQSMWRVEALQHLRMSRLNRRGRILMRTSTSIGLVFK